MYLLLICLVTCIGTALYAQTPNTTWAKGMGGLGGDNGYSIATDAAGNVYTVGYFNGTVDFDPSPSVYNLTSSLGSSSAFVSKLDMNGNFVWAEAIGGNGAGYAEGYGITVDASGNVYTTGSYYGTVDFDPSISVYNLSALGGLSGGMEDIFVSKLDSNGHFVWAKSMGGASGIDRGLGIAVDVSGNVYTTGYFRTAADFDPSVTNFTVSSAGGHDIFVCKLNGAGNFVWAKAMGGSSGDDFGYDIKVDVSGNVYTTGTFLNSGDFDPSSTIYNLGNSGTSNNIFISKLNGNGNFVWAKAMGGLGVDFGNSIAVDSSGNVYATGKFSGTADFDPSTSIFNLTSLGSTDIFVSKLDISGNFVWAKVMGGSVGDDIGYGISVDACGYVYTIGTYKGPVDFDPSVSTYILNSSSTLSTDLFISKLDPIGNFVWAKAMYRAFSRRISIDANGNIYTTGGFSDTTDFNPSGTAMNLISAGGGDIFVAKILNTNIAPVFSNATNTLSICQDANAMSINSLLQITDPDTAQTETYTILVTPNQGGTITIGTTTVGSGSNVTPTGWAYTPASGFSGTETFTLQVCDGNTCPATIMITVTVHLSSTSSSNQTSCDSLTWNAITYTSSGTYSYTTTNSVGCDSTATLNLIINTSTSSTTNVTANNSYTWTANGMTYTISGIYTSTTTNAAGCPEVATLHLTIKPEGIHDLTANENTSCHVYPIPAKHSIHVELEVKQTQMTTIKIVDISGRLVKEVATKTIAGQQNIEISLAEMAKGLYTVQVFQNNNLIHVAKIEKEE